MTGASLFQKGLRHGHRARDSGSVLVANTRICSNLRRSAEIAHMRPRTHIFFSFCDVKMSLRKAATPVLATCGKLQLVHNSSPSALMLARRNTIHDSARRQTCPVQPASAAAQDCVYIPCHHSTTGGGRGASAPSRGVVAGRCADRQSQPSVAA